MTKPELVSLSNYKEYPPEEMLRRSEAFLETMKKRRTVRNFSDREIDIEVIKNCILAAGTAPNGANMQPWHFVIVSDPGIKKEIRIGVENEEHEFYSKKAPKEWLDALAPLGTDENKPFLEKAPCLIIVFSKSYDFLPGGEKVKTYYALESTGISCGMLITAIHNAGLVSLTHTPSPMRFLNKILKRPVNEKPFLILVVGYPANDAKVPVIKKKALEEIADFI